MDSLADHNSVGVTYFKKICLLPKLNVEILYPEVESGCRVELLMLQQQLATASGLASQGAVEAQQERTELDEARWELKSPSCKLCLTSTYT